MEYVISSIWTLLEAVSFCVFCDAFLERKQRKIPYLVTLLFFWVTVILFAFLRLPAPFQQIGVLCLNLAWSFYLYRGKLLHRILIVVVHIVLAAAIDTIMVYGTSMLTGISYSDLVWRKRTYVAVVSAGKLLTVLIAYTTQYLRKRNRTQLLRNNWLLLTLLFPAVSYFMIVVIFRSYVNEDDLSIGSFVLCGILGIADAAIIYMIRQMEKSTRREQETLLLNQQMELQTQSILDLERSYRAQRQASHEFQRHLQMIKDLLEMENKDEALSYVKKLQGMQSTRIFSVNSHHPIIDAILNQKFQQAKENEIDMQIQVNDLSQISIPTDALVVLLSNLLDNAVEACLRIPEQRLIHCCICQNESLFISIRNTSLPVVINNGRIQTSKPSKLEHGIGLISICRILEDLQAEYTYNYENNWFQFVTEIPLT